MALNSLVELSSVQVIHADCKLTLHQGNPVSWKRIPRLLSAESSLCSPSPHLENMVLSLETKKGQVIRRELAYCLHCRLDSKINGLQALLETTRSACLLRAEQLLYDERVLSERKPETAAIVMHQRRKITAERGTLAAHKVGKSYNTCILYAWGNVDTHQDTDHIVTVQLPPL